MKKSTFGYKEVAEICKSLLNQGKTPSIHSIRSMIGDGSPNKALGYLRQWQKEHELSVTVDDDLSADFKQALSAECAQKLSAVKEQLQVQIDNRETQITDLQVISPILSKAYPSRSQSFSVL